MKSVRRANLTPLANKFFPSGLHFVSQCFVDYRFGIHKCPFASPNACFIIHFYYPNDVFCMAFGFCTFYAYSESFVVSVFYFPPPLIHAALVPKGMTISDKQIFHF